MSSTEAKKLGGNELPSGSDRGNRDRMQDSTDGLRPEPPKNEGLVDWLLACPEKGFFVCVASESTATGPDPDLFEALMTISRRCRSLHKEGQRNLEGRHCRSLPDHDDQNADEVLGYDEKGTFG